MKRLVWGAIIAGLGLLFMAGASGNPNGPLPSYVLGMLCLVGGGLLMWSGIQQRSLEKRAGDAALTALQANGFVRCDELGRLLGVGEYRARVILRRLQVKGLVPLRVER